MFANTDSILATTTGYSYTTTLLLTVQVTGYYY